jgi:hypothetical protein
MNASDRCSTLGEAITHLLITHGSKPIIEAIVGAFRISESERGYDPEQISK